VKPTSDLSGLYRNYPAYRWVEDEDTRTYLDAAWAGESRIKIYVASGYTHLQAVVNAAHHDFSTHVFGFRDRDFGASNRKRWKEEAVTVLAGDAHELENFLLDAEAIASCEVNTSGLNAAQIEHELLAIAQQLPWWMSCRRTITEMRDAVMNDFPGHPKYREVSSQQQAENAIFASPWWMNALPSLHTTWGNRTTVSARLAQHEASFRAMLTNNTWQREFSGKEILQEIVTKVWTRKRPADPAGRLEFVRAIAEAQRDQKRLPPELTELRTAILSRIGR